MLALLFAYALTQGSFSEAGPVPTFLQRDVVDSYNDQDSRRTVYNIVWSCLSTIFLCTWIAIHPNIAFRPEKPRVGWFEKGIWDPLVHFLSYKLPLFLWALLVPEYILAWAVRQYLMAGEIEKRGWTRVHGFFVLMGGFHLFQLPAGVSAVSLSTEESPSSNFILPYGIHSRDAEVPVCPLQMGDLPIYVLCRITPTETELRDRGKSDGLSKFIALTQTTWFVVQCIARGIQHLRLTELEVVTLAYAMLNFFIYVFWWDKPQNVECPIRVYKASVIGYKSHPGPQKWGDHWLPHPIERILQYAIGGQDQLDDKRLFEASVGPTILGTVFGAIHCIAWSFTPPNHLESIIWRISCAAMTAVPLFGALLCTTGRISYSVGERSLAWLNTMTYISYLFMALSTWLYITSRIASLVIAFTTLRSLPTTALEVVEWTIFIPHI